MGVKDGFVSTGSWPGVMPPSSAYCCQRSASINSAAASSLRMAISPGVGRMGKAAFARPRDVSRAPADRANPAKPKFFRKPRRLVAIGRVGSFASPDFTREISLGGVLLLDIINRPFRLPQLHDLVKSCDPLNTSGAKIFVSIPWRSRASARCRRIEASPRARWATDSIAGGVGDCAGSVPRHQFSGAMAESIVDGHQ